MAKRVTMIDPPSGWKFGFPKVFDKLPEVPLEKWLVENGYPQYLIDQGMAEHCWFSVVDVDE